MNAFKSIAIVVVVAVFLVVGLALPAGAEVIVSAKGGLFWMEHDYYTTHNTGLNYGVSLQYIPPLENRVMDVGIEFMTGQFQSTVPFVTINSREVTRKVRVTGFLMTTHYRPPLSTTIQPYIGGGIGSYSFEGSIKQPIGAGGTGLDSFTSSRAGYNLDAGVDFRLGPHWIVGLEYRYVSANLSYSNNNIPYSWMQNLNFMTTQFAVRYAF